MNKCPFCGGALVEQGIRYPQVYQGRIVILENVPAEVCRQCGEVLLRPETLERVQKLVWEDAPPSHIDQVPVYVLS